MKKMIIVMGNVVGIKMDKTGQGKDKWTYQLQSGAGNFQVLGYVVSYVDRGWKQGDNVVAVAFGKASLGKDQKTIYDNTTLLSGDNEVNAVQNIVEAVQKLTGNNIIIKF